MDRLELFKNLMVMAFADGKLTSEEVAYLAVRAEKWGLTDGQVASAIKYAARADSRLTIPETKGERLEMLRQLIRTMAADGELADIEKKLFAVAAARMEIAPTELDAVIDSLLQ